MRTIKATLCVLTLLVTGCATPKQPARITDDMGRVWEQCGVDTWCCISEPPMIYVPAPAAAF